VLKFSSTADKDETTTVKTEEKNKVSGSLTQPVDHHASNSKVMGCV